MIDFNKSENNTRPGPTFKKSGSKNSLDFFIQPSSRVYASRCHEVSSNLTKSTGKEHSALESQPLDEFRIISSFLAVSFSEQVFFVGS